MVAFALSCFGLLLFLWVAFGGPVPFKPQGYRFTTSFGEATQLAVEADVRISGVPVGKVKSIETDARGRSAVIELEAATPAADRRARRAAPEDAPRRDLRGADAGHRGRAQAARARPAADGQVSGTVELDEIFRAFDARTRTAFQGWLQNQALAIDGRGRDVSDALGNLQSFATDAHSVVRVLNRQQGGVQQLVANTGEVFGALTERGEQLRELIENANRGVRDDRGRDSSCATASAPPTFEREATDTVHRLSQFAATPIRSSTSCGRRRELSPTLTDLSALAPDLKAFFRESNPLIDASKAGFPAAERVLQDLRPLLGQIDPFLRQVIPMPATSGSSGRAERLLREHDRGDAGSTVPGARPLHYLRTSNPFNPENLAVTPGVWRPTGPTRTRSPATSADSRGLRCTRLATAAAAGSRRSSTRRSRSPLRARCAELVAGAGPGRGAERRERRQRHLQAARQLVRGHPALRLPERSGDGAGRAAVQAAGAVRRLGRAVAVPPRGARLT